jgi:PAS domain S-box-containing protein
MVLRDVSSLNPTAVDEFRALAEGLPCIAWMADGNGDVDWVAKGFRDYSGLAQGAVIGWGWLRSVHPDDQAIVTREWTKSITSGSELDTIVRLRSSEGFFRSFSARARPLLDERDRITCWFGTLTDIDDRQLILEANDLLVDALMKGYLSKKWPSVAGVKFDTHYRSTNVLERLGGDWYDIFTLPDGRIAFSLGDVCGHGIDAAVKMGEAKQAIIVAACLGDPAPGRVFEFANKVIFLNGHDVSMATALYGIIDTTRRTVTYASAGHHPPVLGRVGAKATVLPNRGFPLGVVLEMPPQVDAHEFTYEPGSMLVLYTDGLIEFDHDIFDGEARLLDAVDESIRLKAEYPAQFIVDCVLGDALPVDDVVVLTVSFQ